MIDERFSTGAFEAKGLDTEAAADLAAELAEVVARILHDGVRPVIAQVVQDLNRLGHAVKASEVDATGRFAFRDERVDAQGDHARLRLAVDIVVSTGYAHDLTAEQLLAEVKDLNKRDD